MDKERRFAMEICRVTAAQAVVSFLLLFVIPCVILDASTRGVDALSKKQRDEVVEKVAKLLEDNYVYPDIGKTVSKLLLESHRQGRYSQLASPQDFADLLDADLTEWSNDKHLGVVYDPDWVSQIKGQDAEKSEYLTEDMLDDERRKNFGFRRIDILDGNIGYVDLRIFFHPKYGGGTAVAAMNYVSNCDALIIDLRNNGGGWGTMVALLCSYFLDNEETVHLMSAYCRPEDRHYQSWTAPYVPGRIMSDIPLYILTSKSTFSAAEEFCYNMKYLKRATIVGDRTRGGAHPIDTKVLSDDFILILPEWRSYHPVTDANWEGVGVEPDVIVPGNEAFDIAYMDALEKLRESARKDKEKVQYQWHIDGFKSKLHPVGVDLSVLQSYAGTYGMLNISFENNVLFYQRGDRAKYRMTPMAEDLFMIEEISSVRLRFVRDGALVKGLIALYSDGEKIEYPKK